MIKRTLALMLVTCLLFAGLVVVSPIASADDLDHPEGMAKTAGLIAGGGNVKGAVDVGDIYVWNDCDNVYVQFVIVDSTPGDPLDNWYITETHVAVATALADIAQANGNPIPGQFAFVRSHANVDEYTQVVPKGDIPIGSDFIGELYVAAHATVCKGGVDGLMLALPDTVTVQSFPTDRYRDCYYPAMIVSSGTWLDGTYDGWSANVGIAEQPFSIGYPATVYSTYGDVIPYAVVEKQENLNAVNWLLNHKADYIGQTWTVCAAPAEAPSWWTAAMGTYDPSIYPTEVTVTWFDFQMAIWYLLDSGLTYDPEYCFMHKHWLMQSKVGYDIAQEALANGEGFVPSCGQSMAVVLAPYTGLHRDQPILVEVPVPCKTCQTSWGSVLTETMNKKGSSQMTYGLQFSGANWASYIKYQVTACPVA